jgi:rubrerythrin
VKEQTGWGIGECECLDQPFKGLLIGILSREAKMNESKGRDPKIFVELMNAVRYTPICKKTYTLDELIEKQIKDEDKAITVYAVMAGAAADVGDLSAQEFLAKIAKQEAEHKQALEYLASSKKPKENGRS